MEDVLIHDVNAIKGILGKVFYELLYVIASREQRETTWQSINQQLYKYKT